MRKLIALVGALAGAVVLVPAAFAATATPFGGATVAADGTLTLVSNTGDASAANDFSGASFTGTGVTTFATLTTLSTEFNVTDDDCSDGSPRFQVRVQTPSSGEKNVFVYLGPTPSFKGCSPNAWIASGNLVGSADKRFDASQVQAGTQVSDYAQVLAIVGTYQVTGISLVVDSGGAFADKEQTVNVRNVKVNGSTFYEPAGPKPPTSGMNPAQACKKLRADMGVEAFRVAYGENGNGKNAFGKCVSKMARMKNDVARTNAVERIGDKADRCTERAASDRGKGHGKAKGHAKTRGKSLAACLKQSV